MANQVHRNIVSSYANRLVGLAGVLVLVPLYTRFLGHRLCGEWLVITSIVPYLALANAGVDQTLVNRISENVANRRASEIHSLLSTVFFAYCIIAAGLTAAFALLSPRIVALVVGGADTRASFALFLVAALYALALPWTAYIATLRGFERVDQEQAVAACTSLGRNTVLAIAVISGFGLVPLALIQGTTAVIRGFGAYMRSLHLMDDPHPRWSAFSLPKLGSLIRPSLGFFVLQAAGIVGFGIDNLVIGWALGPEAVTRYAVPYSLVMMAAGFFATAMAAVMPTITLNFARSNLKNLANSFLLNMQLAMFYGTVSVVALSMAGPWMLRLWAGPGVFPGIATFRLQIAVLFIQVFVEPAYAVLLASTRHYGASALHVVESALNLGLSLWWVHRWGLSGIVAGTVVARLLTTGWYIPLAALAVLDTGPGFALKKLGPTALLAVSTSALATLCSWSAKTSASVAPRMIAGLGFCAFVLAYHWIGLSPDDRRELSERLDGFRRWMQSA